MARAPLQVLVIPFRQNRDGNPKYAIFRRADESYWYGIAVGGQDCESPIEAAKREAFEEAHIPVCPSVFKLQTVSSVPISGFSVMVRKHWSKNLYVIPNYYFAVESSDVEVVLSHEHTEYRWVPNHSPS